MKSVKHRVIYSPTVSRVIGYGPVNQLYVAVGPQIERQMDAVDNAVRAEVYKRVTTND